MLLSLYNLHILAPDQKSFNFSKQHLSSFRYKKHLLIGFFLATFEHFFFWEIKRNFLEISSNLWKTLTRLIERQQNWKIKMQSFLVNDNNLWVNILYVLYCITLVFSLNEKLSFRWRCRKFRFRILFTS